MAEISQNRNNIAIVFEQAGNCSLSTEWQISYRVPLFPLKRSGDELRRIWAKVMGLMRTFEVDETKPWMKFDLHHERFIRGNQLALDQVSMLLWSLIWEQMWTMVEFASKSVENSEFYKVVWEKSKCFDPKQVLSGKTFNAYFLRSSACYKRFHGSLFASSALLTTSLSCKKLLENDVFCRARCQFSLKSSKFVCLTFSENQKSDPNVSKTPTISQFRFPCIKKRNSGENLKAWATTKFFKRKLIECACY